MFCKSRIMAGRNVLGTVQTHRCRLVFCALLLRCVSVFVCVCMHMYPCASHTCDSRKMGKGKLGWSDCYGRMQRLSKHPQQSQHGSFMDRSLSSYIAFKHWGGIMLVVPMF